MKARPVIGVIPLWDETKDSYWMLPGYMEGITAAGGLPVMLPLTDEEEILKQAAEMCDGFLFTGGHDVSPEVYNSTSKFDNIECCKMRDSMEMKLLREILIEEKPLLGICRGIQFLNAAMGGTLYQDLPGETDSGIEHHQSPPYDVPVHKVKIETDSPLYRLLHTEELAVNSYHHQAVRTIAPPLKVMAYAEDGIIEAVYMPSRKFVWAVQWHPEFSYLTDNNSFMIFEEFVNNCK